MSWRNIKHLEVCRICGKVFVSYREKNKRKTCSNVCKYKYLSQLFSLPRYRKIFKNTKRKIKLLTRYCKIFKKVI